MGLERRREQGWNIFCTQKTNTQRSVEMKKTVNIRKTDGIFKKKKCLRENSRPGLRAGAYVAWKLPYEF